MSDFSNYTETQIIDWMSQGAAMPSAPGTVYVALHTGDPGDDGSASEVGAADYAREGVTAGTGWNTPTTDTFENAAEISFGTAANNWGTISHVSLWDAATGGNCLAVGSLSAAKAVNVDDEATFAAGDLSFTVD